jgi:hypothetical protein
MEGTFCFKELVREAKRPALAEGRGTFALHAGYEARGGADMSTRPKSVSTPRGLHREGQSPTTVG